MTDHPRNSSPYKIQIFCTECQTTTYLYDDDARAVLKGHPIHCYRCKKQVAYQPPQKMTLKNHFLFAYLLLSTLMILTCLILQFFSNSDFPFSTIVLGLLISKFVIISQNKKRHYPLTAVTTSSCSITEQDPAADK